MDFLKWLLQLPSSAWLMFIAGLAIGAFGGYWIGHDYWLKYYQSQLIQKNNEDERKNMEATKAWVDYLKHMGGQR